MGDDYRIKILEQQLADREKQIVLLRAVVEYARTELADGNDEVLTKALAATQDLSDYILCDAEPVAWLNPYGGVLHVLTTGLEKSTYTIPLYKASKT